MKKFENVYSTIENVKEVEFNVDTVYVRSNIVRLDDMWCYDEAQYTYQEWQEVQENKISILEEENENLKEGLQAVLRGDMQSLAYILYPEDFNNIRTYSSSFFI
ncbi:hypothetical protein [Romboutsia ilealis]|uniref:hypothetical protein n=1 Tax=Romboutsia ilealis TaxID=1115758 RepID=UPI002572C6C4|nr:hypothetical protein [Romboutsia ilealis]